MDGVSEEDVVERGAQRTIAWATDSNGARPAKEFLESSKVPKKDRRVLERSFMAMAQVGKISNKQKFRKEQGEIWGFKSFQIRIGAFLDGRVWYLTHGFIKKGDKWPPKELAKAERIRHEHLQRTEKT